MNKIIAAFMALLSLLFGLFSFRCTKPWVAPKEMSERGQQLLEEYKEYVTHGIVFDMDMEDVFFVLGPLKGTSETDGSNFVIYQYENIEIWVDPEYGNKIVTLLVCDGIYLGLTVGKSTKDDADLRFGAQEDDYFFEEPDGFGYSRYKERNGVDIGIRYQNRIITRISVSAAVAP